MADELAGLRVLEFTHTIMGPTCGLALADFGAEVIRVEQAPDGDRTRRLAGFAAGFYPCFNRNKLSVVLDLKSEDGRDAALDLIASADVLIENFGPGALDRLGLGWDAAHARNPRLIYCALKGFLPGPYAHRPALDEVVQFMTGLAHMTGPPGQPLRAGASVVDILGGIMGTVAILAALRARDRDDQGRHITSALYETSAFLVAQHMAGEAASGQPVPPMPARRAAWGIYETFATKDGTPLFLGITSDTHWRAFCALFDRPDLLADPRYASNNDRVAHRDTLRPTVASLLATRPFQALCAAFDAVNIPFSPVRTPSDLFDDPQLRLLATRMADGTLVGLPGLPVAIDGQSPALRRQPPSLGADTDATLAGLGYDQERIARLRHITQPRVDAS